MLTAEELKKKWDNDSNRRDKARATTSIYDEEWEKLLKQEIEKRFTSQEVLDRLKSVAETTLNPLKWASEKTGAIYSKAPKRFIGEEEISHDSPLIRDGSYDAVLDEACQLAQAHRDLFIRIVVDNEDGENKDPDVELDLLLPEQVCVERGSKLTSINWIIYSLQVGDSIQYQYWDAENHGTLNKDWEWIMGGVKPNPYKMIPVAAVHAKFPARKFWQSSQNNALRRTTLEAGVAMSSFRYLQKMQSFKILNLPSEPEQGFVLDAGNPLVTPNGTATVLDWEANLTVFLEVIISHIALVLNFMGIRPEAVKGTLDASSGYALSIKMNDLQIIWSKLRILWTLWEKDIINISRAVYEVEAKRELVGRGGLSIQYQEIGHVVDPKEQAALGRQYLDIGMSRRNMWLELGKTIEWIEANFQQALEESVFFDSINIPLAIPTEKEEE